MTRAEWVIRSISGYPVERDGSVSFDKYKEWKKKTTKRDSQSVYDVGEFKITEINKEGYMVLSKNRGEAKKVLIRPNMLEGINVGDKVVCTLGKKIFFVYWEIIDFKKYISVEG